MALRIIDPDCRDGKCSSCVGGPCEHECHQQQEMPADPVTSEQAYSIEVKHMYDSYLDAGLPADVAKQILAERQAAYWNAYFTHMFDGHGCGRPFADGSGICGAADV